MNITALYKQIKFVTKSLMRISIGYVIGLLIWRDKNIIIMGNCPNPVFSTNSKNEQFLHNTKYLFLYLNNVKNSKFKYIYLCDDKEKRKIFKQRGLKNVFPRLSFLGIYYALKAKYWLTDYDVQSVTSSCLSYGATIINFFHGYGPKKVIYDDDKYPQKKYKPLIFKIWDTLRLKENYVIVNSESEAKYFKSALITKEDAQVILGSPRLDALFNDIKNSNLFMEDEINNIKKLKEDGYKLLIYMPTWRDTGSDISGWLNNIDLQKSLEKNKTIIICKLHPQDRNFSHNIQDKTLYFMKKNSDVYPILKYTDGLISDYSSIFVDYLLLDKPIIYYIYDIKEYQEQCRGFFSPFEEFVAGETPKNENQLIESLLHVINKEDFNKERRKELRDKFFVYQDGKNCERFIKFIESLNSK